MKITRLPSALEQRNKRVAAYARVSTLFEEQEESYTSQCEYFRQLIESTPGWDLVDIYADQGKSGLSADKRPDFLRMIEDCKKGLIDIVLVKSISRFGRNSAEVQEYVHILREYNVEVQFDRENLSSFNPNTEMVFSFMAAVAEEESKSISDNVKVSLAWNAAKGIRHIGNNRLYGFQEVNGHLTPDPETSWIPELIFKEFADGIGYVEICRHLELRGAKRMREKTSEKTFTPDVLLSILKNEIYMGDRVIQRNPPINLKTKRIDKNAEYQQYYVRNDHDPIISKEIWDKCQQRLAAEIEERTSKNVYKKSTCHFMYGKIFCGECGEPMVRKTIIYGSTMQKCWKCKDRVKGKKGNGCKNVVFSEADLFYVICIQANIKWTGLENITAETFENVKEVRIYSDRHIELTYEE